MARPVVANVRGLYPFAVTRARDGKMNRMIALAAVLGARPDKQACTGDLVDAVLAEDIPRLRRLLVAAGIDFSSD